MKRALVFTGGTVESYNDLPIEICNGDLIICADRGIEHCIKMKLVPDIWVGDFDSADFDSYIDMEELRNTDIIKLPQNKDDTDTEHALHIAVQKGCQNIILVGGFGTRFDHTLANAFLAEEAYRLNVVLTMLSEKNILHYLCDGKLRIKKSCYKYISVIPLEDSLVTCEGFRYPLKEETLLRGPARGVSNELVSEEGCITIHKGSAFVIESVD